MDNLGNIFDSHMNEKWNENGKDIWNHLVISCIQSWKQHEGNDKQEKLETEFPIN